MSLLSLAIFTVLSAPAHADERLVGAWSTTGFAVEFAANGAFAAQMNGQYAQGQWAADGVTLQTQPVGGQVVPYAYQVSGNQLLLQDPWGSQILLQRVAASQPAAPQSAPVQTGGVMSQQEWLAFLESYPSMSPDGVYAGLSRMDANMWTMIEVFGALRADLLYRACYSNYAGQITLDGGCGNIIASRQQEEMLAAQMGMALTEHETQRQQVANNVRCSLGLIDSGTCQAGYGLQQNYNNMMNQTTTQTIENMTPVPCTEYFDQNNVYLGCW